jgi:hypothetical protein
MIKVKETFNFDNRTAIIIKGIAISLMIFHHLFGFPSWIVGSNKYIGLGISGISFDSKLAEFGRICIDIFAFITGYGYYFVEKKGHEYKNGLKSITKLYLNYWIILFVIFVPLNILSGNFNTDIYKWVITIFAINSNGMIPFAWYINFYALALITLPLIKRMIGKNIFNSLVVATLPFYSFRVLLFFSPSAFKDNIFMQIVDQYMFYMPTILLGYCFSKFKIFDYIYKFQNKLKLNNTWFNISLVVALFICRDNLTVLLGLNMDIFYVPLYVYLQTNILQSVNILKLNIILSLLGRNSLNLWLLHAIFFFGTSKLQNLIYFPRISILIFTWTILILLPISKLIQLIMDTIINLIRVNILEGHQKKWRWKGPQKVDTRNSPDLDTHTADNTFFLN